MNEKEIFTNTAKVLINLANKLTITCSPIDVGAVDVDIAEHFVVGNQSAA
jgi:hypothetical protein